MYFPGINTCRIDLGARVCAFHISSAAEQPRANLLASRKNLPELRGFGVPTEPTAPSAPGTFRCRWALPGDSCPRPSVPRVTKQESYLTKGKRKAKPNPSYFGGRDEQENTGQNLTEVLELETHIWRCAYCKRICKGHNPQAEVQAVDGFLRSLSPKRTFLRRHFNTLTGKITPGVFCQEREARCGSPAHLPRAASSSFHSAVGQNVG